MDGEGIVTGAVRVVLSQDGSTARKGMDWPESRATDADLATINAMPGVSVALAAEDVFVRGVYAINDLPLQGQYRGLKVGAEAVRALAGVAPGAPVQCNHDTGWAGGRSALPVATVFRADTVVEAGVTWTRMWLYFAATEGNAELVQRVDAGNIGEVSIGAAFKRVQCGICGLSPGDCEHQALNIYNGRECLFVLQDPDELYELSLVWAGAAQGTHFFMAAARGLDDVRQLVRGDGSRVDTLGVYFPAPKPLDELFDGGGSPAP